MADRMQFSAERLARLRRDIDQLRTELEPYEAERMFVRHNGVDVTPKRIAVIKGEIATLEKIVRAAQF